MTVRNYFRQLRRQQWELDNQFFSCLHRIFPPAPEPIAIQVCDPRVVQDRILIAAFQDASLYLRAHIRYEEFLILHDAVIYGRLQIAAIVETLEAQFDAVAFVAQHRAALRLIDARALLFVESCTGMIEVVTGIRLTQEETWAVVDVWNQTQSKHG